MKLRTLKHRSRPRQELARIAVYLAYTVIDRGYVRIVSTLVGKALHETQQ